MSDERRVTAGSGNLYDDLGFEEPDLELVKADLAREIVRILEERHLTQEQAAKILRVNQLKVSALMNGRLGLFSPERLILFLARLDRDVEITVAINRSPRPAARIALVNATPQGTDVPQTPSGPHADERETSVIRRDPEIMSGTPVFAGTRVPVRNLIDYLKAGDDLDVFLDQFPSVSREQAVAALEEMALETIGLLHERRVG